MSADAKVLQALERIQHCADPIALRQIADNARRLGHDAVETAALRKLFATLPSAEPGSLEFDVWQSIHALEHALSSERGNTTRLSRTRQKIDRDGEEKTVADLIVKPASKGYHMLVERGMPELTFEYVALRHPKRFDGVILEAARQRLAESKIEFPTLA